MAYLFLAILPAALIISAVNDLSEYKIPNWVSLILIAGFPFAVISVGLPHIYIWQGLLVGFAVLAVGFALFALNIMGGGDAKLLAAAAPWFGFDAQVLFLVGTTFAGGVFAMVILAFRGFPLLPIYARFPWLWSLHQSKKGMPYGVAIAIGGLFAFPESEIFISLFGR